MFYSKSSDKKPGFGAHEELVSGETYPELQKIKDWRKVLSNFHFSPFVYKNLTFNSIEHVYHYEKIKLANEKEAFRFTVDSGDPIGKGDGLTAKKN